MPSITRLLGIPLGALISVCYRILHNYGLAIALFTLLTKVILFPISIWTHRNSLKMVSLMPELNELKVRFYGDNATIAEETQKLYKRVGYHPLLSMVPMVIQLVLLMGVVGAVRELLGDSGSVLMWVPFEAGGATLLMPAAAGLAALTLGLAQNHINPLQREQSKRENLVTNAGSVAISLFLGTFVPLGTGLYWVFSNLFTILNQLVVNAAIPPEKHIDYEALRESKKKLAGIEALTPKISREDKQREKADYKRFFSVANKHLVFYSEKSGFYKYFKKIIEYLLTHSNVIIHYVTNDPRDQVFELAKQQPHIRPYYIGQKKLITLFMKMDADIVVMTTPDLDNFYLKRSYVRKDIEYIYIHHTVTSTNLTTNKGCYDHFDTIFCSGQHQIDEFREAEEIYQLPAKKLVKAGYGLLDSLIAQYESRGSVVNSPRQILIAPSWQEGNILDTCLDEMVEGLRARGYFVIVRPHPEYVKRYPGKMDKLRMKYLWQPDSRLVIEDNFSSNDSIFMSDLIITDWSGIAYEYSLCTLRPTLFIDTPMKVLNADYKRYRNQPTDITWRNLVGVSIRPEEAGRAAEYADRMIDQKDAYREKIEAMREQHVFNIGSSGMVSGQYILSELKNKQEKHG